MITGKSKSPRKSIVVCWLCPTRSLSKCDGVVNANSLVIDKAVPSVSSKFFDIALSVIFSRIHYIHHFLHKFSSHYFIDVGATFPFATLESWELANALKVCSSLLGCDEAETKPLKSSKNSMRRSLTLIWAHLLSKSLPQNSIAFSKSKFAAISASLMWCGDLLLSDIAEPLHGGKYHPLFLLVLQQLRLMVDELPEHARQSASVSRECSTTLGVQCVSLSTMEERRAVFVRWFREGKIRMNQMMPG